MLFFDGPEDFKRQLLHDIAWSWDQIEFCRRSIEFAKERGLPPDEARTNDIIRGHMARIAKWTRWHAEMSGKPPLSVINGGKKIKNAIHGRGKK